MSVKKSISSYLNENVIDYQSKKYILAVSGGVDSMVLLNCFQLLNLNFEVAHYNFQLRGKESEGDEQLVRTICLENNIVFNVESTDTNSYAKEKKLSIQEAARNLRYDWFFKLQNEKKADYIITAHHQNDSIETFFINLLRGSGIDGLCGIRDRNHIIRPLLSCSRADIELYASTNKVKFRLDSSNESVKYKRNYLRKNIIPELNKLQDNSSSSILKSIDLLKQTNTYLAEKIEEDIRAILSVKENVVTIDVSNLTNPFVLFYALNKYGFNSSQIQSIQKSFSNVGAQFYSKYYELVIDRECLLIKPIKEGSNEAFQFNSFGFFDSPIAIEIDKIDFPNSLKTTNNCAYFDANKLVFPIELRKWKEGDSFYPLGMHGRKKISDYFVDNKFSKFDKENTWLLVSEGNIAWIINHQMDNRYKITSNTKDVIRVVTK